MTREERCKHLIDRGMTYCKDTGIIRNKFGKEIKSKTNRGYIKLQVSRGVITLAHIFAWYFIYGECVDCIDHINRNKSDNRISNLRSITQQQNMFNTDCKGYSYKKSYNKWQSEIRINGKSIYLGYFNTEQEARQAYLDAKKIYHII